MKRRINIIMLLVVCIACAFVFVACGSGSDSVDDNVDKFVSVAIEQREVKGQKTKQNYYVDEEFSAADTLVNLKVYDKEQNKELWYLACPLSDIPNSIRYEVTEFDTSTITADSEYRYVHIVFTSDKYAGKLTAALPISVLEPYAVECEPEVGAQYIKDIYAVGDTIPIEEMTLKVTYSNGKSDTVAMTDENVSIDGFDTDTVDASKRTAHIRYLRATYSFNYVVAPAENYTLFEDLFIRCFVPNEELGFKKSAPSSDNEFLSEWSSDGYSYTIEMCCYRPFTYSETFIKSHFSTTSSAFQTNVEILSSEKLNINYRNMTVYTFRNKGSKKTYKAAYYDTQIKQSNGSVTTTSSVTVEIIFYGYDGDMVTVFDNVLNSVR